MNRRNALKGLATAVAGISAGFSIRLAQAAEYTGKLLVSVQADGGWDPSNFCDPKTNTPGEPIITHWSETDTVRTAGNIPFAPFANNAAFFDKYYDRMLVINGVDAQTNSHTVGVTHNWSGRTSEGFPTVTALTAAHYGTDLPASYLSFGGFSKTAGVARYTRISNPLDLQNIAYPPRHRSTNRHYVSMEDWDALLQFSADTSKRIATRANAIPSESFRQQLYQSAISRDDLKRFADAIPASQELEQRIQSGPIAGSRNQYNSTLRRQAQLAVLAFKTGASLSADLIQGGFDTHQINDPDAGWLLAQLTDGVDFLWEYAREHGIDDRLLVVIGSDFGRTNYYNATDGKDHWPIGSYIVMEKNQPWTNRVVAGTDHLQFARKINPTTLGHDATNGSIIYPKHFHKALRDYLAIAESAGSLRHPFNNTEVFSFFEAQS